MHLQPQDIYPSFSWERLKIVAQILFDIRNWVAMEARPDRGDTGCGIGFRAWEQSKDAIAKASAFGEHKSWLSLQNGSSHFIFKLGGMPIRFCRGDSEKPLPSNYAYPSTGELIGVSNAFEAVKAPPVDGIFRMVIEADPKGFPVRVLLVHARVGGEILMAWPIPVGGEGTGVIPVTAPLTPVVLPGLQVLSVAEAAARKKEVQVTPIKKKEA